MRIAGDSGRSVLGHPEVRVGYPVTVATFPLCVVGAPVQVTSIRLLQPRGLRLVDWGWQPSFAAMQAAPEGMAAKAGYKKEPINVTCGEKYGATVGITVERTDSSAGTARAYTISYAGGSLTVPFGTALCLKKCTDRDMRAAGD